MLHTAQSPFNKIFFYLAIFAGCIVIGCSLIDKKPSAHSRLSEINKQKVYSYSYDNVWRAANTVLKYPIAVENQDNGVIETEFIKGLDGWTPPGEEKVLPSSGVRYKLLLTFVRGKIDGKESTRVTIEKRMEKLRDFFSESENLESDGLEEKILFYRIERELVISEVLKKAN